MSQHIAKTIAGLVETIRQQPDTAYVSFSAESELRDNLRPSIRIRQFTLASDEPHTFGGDDSAPNPVELVLGAFAACQEIVIKAYASALQIPIDGVGVKVKGHLDLRGFLNVAANVRPGFTGIEYVTSIEAPNAIAEQINQLEKLAQTKCPVLDILRNPIPVAGSFVHCELPTTDAA